MAETVKPTRSELMKLKNRIKLAKSGHGLLKKKRDGLILEFFEILKRAKTIRQELTTEYVAALESDHIARTIEGDAHVASLALAVQPAPRLTLHSRNIMGVVVPKISYTTQAAGKGYGMIAHSAVVDAAARSYQALILKAIEAAEVETSMKKLLQEIEKTKRRVNALEFEIIPRLEGQRKFIQMRLDEMDRENVFRMKRIKK